MSKITYYLNNPGEERQGLGGADTEICKEIQPKAKEFVNKITNGSLLNKQTVNHVLNAFKGRSQDSIVAGASTVFVDDKHYSIPYSYNSDFQPKKQINGNWLFFASGETSWYYPEKTLIICNPFSKRFQKWLRGIGVDWNPITPISTSKMSTQEINDLINTTLEKNHHNDSTQENGIRISLATSRNIRWVDVADWIVDIANGKLYKISDANNFGEKSG